MSDGSSRPVCLVEGPGFEFPGKQISTGVPECHKFTPKTDVVTRLWDPSPRLRFRPLTHYPFRGVRPVRDDGVGRCRPRARTSDSVRDVPRLRCGPFSTHGFHRSPVKSSDL